MTGLIKKETLAMFHKVSTVESLRPSGFGLLSAGRFIASNL